MYSHTDYKKHTGLARKENKSNFSQHSLDKTINIQNK